MARKTLHLLGVVVLLTFLLSGSGRPIAAGNTPQRLFSSPLSPDAGITTRVSVASDGTQGNGGSGDPAISADGRYVAFESWASNLVSGDTNGANDVFVHDRQSGATERVSVASDGAQGNDNSSSPAISADGRYVVFDSYASNLVDGDTNGEIDVFVHDRQCGVIERASVASNGSQGNSGSAGPVISADGRHVTFVSYANNLVSGDTNGTADVFVHDRRNWLTERVSVTSDGTQANDDSFLPAISPDGRIVAFQSRSNNLVDGDTNVVSDVFAHERDIIDHRIFLPILTK